MKHLELGLKFYLFFQLFGVLLTKPGSLCEEPSIKLGATQGLSL